MSRFIVLTRIELDPTHKIVNRHLVLVPIRRLFARNAPTTAVRTFTAEANRRAALARIARERREG